MSGQSCQEDTQSTFLCMPPQRLQGASYSREVWGNTQNAAPLQEETDFRTQCLYHLGKVSDQEKHKSSSKGEESGWDAVGAAGGGRDKGYWRSSTASALLLAQNCCCIPGNHSLSSSWACHIPFHLLVPFQGICLICLLGFAVYLHLFSA